MTAQERPPQYQPNLGTYRRDLVNVLNRMQEQYSQTLSEQQKAAMLDQLMVVKADIDKEFKNAVLQRNS